MKNLNTYLFVIACIALTTFAACSSDDSSGPSEETVTLNSLASTWQVESVVVDGENATGFFNGMTITIKADKTFTVTNPVDPIWPASGSFTIERISDSQQFHFKRSDDMIITVTELTENKWSYTLQYSATGGRTSSVSGEYKFVMKK